MKFPRLPGAVPREAREWALILLLMLNLAGLLFVGRVADAAKDAAASNAVRLEELRSECVP